MRILESGEARLAAYEREHGEDAAAELLAVAMDVALVRQSLLVAARHVEEAERLLAKEQRQAAAR